MPGRRATNRRRWPLIGLPPGVGGGSPPPPLPPRSQRIHRRAAPVVLPTVRFGRVVPPNGTPIAGPRCRLVAPRAVIPLTGRVRFGAVPRPNPAAPLSPLPPPNRMVRGRALSLSGHVLLGRMVPPNGLPGVPPRVRLVRPSRLRWVGGVAIGRPHPTPHVDVPGPLPRSLMVRREFHAPPGRVQQSRIPRFGIGAVTVWIKTRSRGKSVYTSRKKSPFSTERSDS